MFNWPLNDNNFSFWDRLKIAGFFLNYKNRWTQDKYVKEFEEKLSSFTGNKYGVFVSSGSTANTLLAMYLKDNTPSERRMVIFPSTTWATSINPFIREGFSPIFLDVTLKDLSLDLQKLDEYLMINNNKVACVFVTSLLGIAPDIDKLKKLELKYPDIKFWMDNCEATMTEYDNRNISSYFTSTTSTYFSHELFSVEGGFVLTNDIDIYEYCVLARSHGLTRALPTKTGISNPLVDHNFDFYLRGTNFRNTDINAFIGILDFKKIERNKLIRKNLYKNFCDVLINERFIKYSANTAMFSTPIIIKPKYNSDGTILPKIKQYCFDNSIEYRPIVSGNLLRQTCFSQYDDYRNFPISEHINNFGFYVGLHPGLKLNLFINFAKFLNTCKSKI